MKTLHPYPIKYVSSEKTSQPGYLADKFQKIIKQQELARKKTQAVVRPIKKEAK